MCCSDRRPASVGASPGLWYLSGKRSERNVVLELHSLLAAMTVLAAATPAAVVAEPAGHITGVGGIFFKSANPKALMARYRDVLGIKLEGWGAIKLRYDAANHPPAKIINAFDHTTDYTSPSKRDYMINFAVDDLTAFLARLQVKGVTVLKRDDSAPHGSFACIVDRDGTKIELWGPTAGVVPQ